MSNDDTKDMVETVDVSPRDPDLPQVPGGDVFRQLLHQAVRVADMANSQAMRMALDFAKVYEREQGVRAQFENQLKQMTLMEKQATRYAEDLAGMLRSERERRQELERALEQERTASGCLARRDSSRPRARSRASTTSAGTAKATPTGRRARRSRSPHGSSRSPTCSTRSLRSVHTKRRGRPKLDSKPSKPERGSALTPSSSPDSSPWPGRACSSASARRSRPRLTTSSSEAQPSKTRPRGDAHQHRQSDEDHESHDQEIREAEPRQHPTQIVPDEIRADRSANESGSSAHDHPDQKSRRFARASACEDDSEDGIDRRRERDPDESQRGAAGAQRRPGPARELGQLFVADERFGRADPDQGDDREDDEPDPHRGTIGRVACSVKRRCQSRNLPPQRPSPDTAIRSSRRRKASARGVTQRRIAKPATGGRARRPRSSARAAGPPRSSSSASSRATKRTSPASRSSARRGASWTKPSTPRESTVTRSMSRTR